MSTAKSAILSISKSHRMTFWIVNPQTNKKHTKKALFSWSKSETVLNFVRGIEKFLLSSRPTVDRALESSSTSTRENYYEWNTSAKKKKIYTWKLVVLARCRFVQNVHATCIFSNSTLHSIIMMISVHSFDDLSSSSIEQTSSDQNQVIKTLFAELCVRTFRRLREKNTLIFIAPFIDDAGCLGLWSSFA